MTGFICEVRKVICRKKPLDQTLAIVFSNDIARTCRIRDRAWKRAGTALK